MRNRIAWMVGACVVAIGCGSPATEPPVDSGGSRTDSGTGMTPDTGMPTPDSGPITGAGDIHGSVNGAPFNTAATALVIGAPDDPATTVVYVFSNAVMCSDLATPGWDRRIPNGTSVLEMKMFGLTPQTYTVVTTATPAPGEATVNHTLSSTSGTPVETGSRSGTVTIATIASMGPATGSFDLAFIGSDHLMGHFNATFCPGGHEP